MLLTSPSQSGLVPEPHVYLRAFFTHRARVTDAPVLFFTYEELCEARPKLPQPPTEEYMTWPVGAVKSFPHRLLHYRINRLNHMLQVRGACAPLKPPPLLTRGARVIGMLAAVWAHVDVQHDAVH